MSDLRSMAHTLVPILTMRFLYWGTGTSDVSAKSTLESLNTLWVCVLLHRTLFMKDQQAFLNTFSLFKLTFFNFLSGGVK